VKQEYFSDYTPEAYDFEAWCQVLNIKPTPRQYRKFKRGEGQVHQARVDFNTNAARKVLIEEAS
jgi:hypothetical protein